MHEGFRKVDLRVELISVVVDSQEEWVCNGRELDLWWAKLEIKFSSVHYQTHFLSFFADRLEWYPSIPLISIVLLHVTCLQVFVKLLPDGDLNLRIEGRENLRSLTSVSLIDHEGD